MTRREILFRVSARDSSLTRMVCASMRTTIFGRPTTEAISCLSWARPVTCCWFWEESTPLQKQTGCSTGQPMWLFAKNGDIYVADGYGNSRVVKFDRYGNYIKAWGKYGTGIGEFNLPHTIAVDKERARLCRRRENQRIQIFDSDGSFIQQWTGIGYPYGLLITPDQHVWMTDGGYDRIVELDQTGKILGAFGEPGRDPPDGMGSLHGDGFRSDHLCRGRFELALRRFRSRCANWQHDQIRSFRKDVLGLGAEHWVVFKTDRHSH